MTSTSFDPWREADLKRFLLAWARLSDTQTRVTGRDVAEALHLEEDTALAAQTRLRKLDLLEESGGPGRMANGRLSTPYVLSRAGTLAALRNELPDL